MLTRDATQGPTPIVSQVILCTMLLAALTACAADLPPESFAPPRPAQRLSGDASQAAESLEQQMADLGAQDSATLLLREAELNALLAAWAAHQGRPAPTVWLRPEAVYLEIRLPFARRERDIQLIAIPRLEQEKLEVDLLHCWIDGQRLPAFPRTLVEGVLNDAIADLTSRTRPESLTVRDGGLEISVTRRAMPNERANHPRD